MFFFNKKEIRDDIVSCEDCGVLLIKEKANKVNRILFSFRLVVPDYEKDIYYCDKHRKSYDLVEGIYNSTSPDRYYKTYVECDENGKILKANQ